MLVDRPPDTASFVREDRAVSDAGRTSQDGSWECPICGGTDATSAFRVPTEGTESGVNASSFRPSAELYGTTVGTVTRCRRCGHGSVAEQPARGSIDEAYADAVDEVSLREEEGQVETWRRTLASVERHVPRGRLLEVGCWTGSLLVAARERGWGTTGIEPSRWASERARERGLDVRTTTLEDHGLEKHAYDLVAMCDVIEHMPEPATAIRALGDLVEPGGGLFVTAPDAGSPLARLLGARWWSVLPMHLQYFTRRSIAELLAAHGFRVVDVRSHPKVFTARYYAERLEGYSAALARSAVRVLERTGQDDRLVAPNFFDRMAVVAVRA
jgi:2-polyprenyl-3-methyl-5-hydroxy-6-metoxy-1,4-benzoquinol methylase